MFPSITTTTTTFLLILTPQNHHHSLNCFPSNTTTTTFLLFSLHHHHHHISIDFHPSSTAPHFCCVPFSTTATTTFLLFSPYHHHHHQIITVSFLLYHYQPWEYSANVNTGKFGPFCPFIYHFSRKWYPFRTPSIDKWYPFHIPSLELCIPCNCCKCTVLGVRFPGAATKNSNLVILGSDCNENECFLFFASCVVPNRFTAKI